MYIADFEDGCRLIGEFVKYYNDIRLHSAINYVAPKIKLAGQEQSIFQQREEKLQAARLQRQSLRQSAHDSFL